MDKPQGVDGSTGFFMVIYWAFYGIYIYIHILMIMIITMIVIQIVIMIVISTDDVNITERLQN